MTAIRNILYAFAGMFLLSVVFVVLPWSVLNGFMAWFGVEPYPDVPLVQYSVKAMMAMLFWIGALMLVVIRQPERYRSVLLVFGWMFLSFAVVALGLGITYDAPKFFYADAFFSAVAGGLFLVFRRQTAPDATGEA